MGKEFVIDEGTSIYTAEVDGCHVLAVKANGDVKVVAAFPNERGMEEFEAAMEKLAEDG